MRPPGLPFSNLFFFFLGIGSSHPLFHMLGSSYQKEEFRTQQHPHMEHIESMEHAVLPQQWSALSTRIMSCHVPLSNPQNICHAI